MLARAALLALSDETITDQTDVHAQAMLEHLGRLVSGQDPRLSALMRNASPLNAASV
jgi:hypothetical protein